jgi:hypothetical protein
MRRALWGGRQVPLEGFLLSGGSALAAGTGAADGRADDADSLITLLEGPPLPSLK